MNDNRISELEAWCSMTGRRLPMPIQDILALEDEGHVVDLVTGEIIIAGADATFELSVAGEAVVLVWEAL